MPQQSQTELNNKAFKISKTFRMRKKTVQVSLRNCDRKHQCMKCDACLYNYVKFMQNFKEKYLSAKEIFAHLK